MQPDDPNIIGGREKRFIRAARELAGDPFWAGWPEEALAAYCEHREVDGLVRCAYCGDGLHQYNRSVDHLLPAGKYLQLNWWTKKDSYQVRDSILTGNAVPCCVMCNGPGLKGSCDPNDNKPVYDKDRDHGVLNPDQRKELISRARRHVQGKLARRRWCFSVPGGA